MWIVNICDTTGTLASWQKDYPTHPTKEQLAESLEPELASKVLASLNVPLYFCTKRLVDGTVFEVKRVTFNV
jgi:hypothetical protein